ncbi:ankyrin repeat, PH and SEC7 domain containing protein secG-like, partial [Mizuhopecten yessoensis]|uniref:ankyrin repeat, PH and SEC7 domain containing protein secG-like n=1 Tax=Mizuhopecten yessoensis TaxID=6573 RepID=UPI000B45D49B
MYKRLLRVFESVYSSQRKSHWFYSKYSKYDSITSLDVWTDIQFLQGFIRWLSGQNDDKNLCHVIKLALLNKACSSGSEECALFLLSEGATPDRETPFRVVKGGSVSVLRKLLEYDVTQTARLDWSRSPHKGLATNINVLQEACLFGREEMVTMLYNTYPHLVHDTDDEGHSTLHHVTLTGNCDIFKTVERVVLKSLYRVEDEHHKCKTVEGRVVHRNCVCVQYVCQLVGKYGGETVLHYSCYGGRMEVCKYLCKSYPALTTAVDNDGYHCLHYIARFTSDVDLFTECETHVKQYLESTGCKYDITTILTDQGESVLDFAEKQTEDWGTEDWTWGTENK